MRAGKRNGLAGFWKQEANITIIQTYTGRRFDLLSPDPEKIEIVDIAWALSMIPRFTGHTRRFYSVAQHSLCVAQMLRGSPDIQFEGLMHDAAEAYIGDISSPMKRLIGLMGDGLKIAEAAIMDAISTRFGLVFPAPKIIKVVDLRMLETERQALMVGSPDIDWPREYRALGIDPPETYGVEITPFDQEQSYNSFLTNFSVLYNDRMARAAKESNHAVKFGAVIH